MKTMISKSFEILSNYFNDKYKIKGYPVHIGITSGVIIEVLTSQPERDNIFNFINYAKEKYHVYGLRHPDDDISEPCSINKNSTLVNRFGWYVTEQEIDFSDNDEIDLKELGISYYDVTNNSFRKTCHPCCIEIDVEKYFKDSYKFWNTTLDYKEYI